MTFRIIDPLASRADRALRPIPQGGQVLRREFVQLAGTSFVGGALAGCAMGYASNTSSSRGDTGDALGAEAFTASRHHLDTPHGRVAYVERGSGPAALFLHGFPLNSFQWRGAIERLSAIRRCIAPDFLALGYTEVASGQSVAPDAQAAMIIALLDRLGISSCDVVANDSGGAVAQLLVAHHPDRVRSLLLTNCDTEIDSPPAALLPVIEMAKAGTFVDTWLAPWLADANLARSAQGLGGMTYTFPERLTDDTIAYYLAPLCDPDRKALVHAYAIALERNPLLGIEATLRGSRVPARIVWGSGDTIFSPGSPAYLDGILPGSRGVRRVEGARLFFPEEYPDLIAHEARTLWG